MSRFTSHRIQRSTPSVLMALQALLLWGAVVVGVAVPETRASGRLGWLVLTAVVGTGIAVVVAVVVARHPKLFSAPAATLSALGACCAALLALPVAAMVAFSVEGAYAAVALFFLVLWLLPEVVGVLSVVVLASLVVLGQAVHHGLGFGGIAGPVITAVAAIAVMWGYRRLVRTADANAQLVEQLREAQQALAASEREAGRIAERSRLARDLHDTTAQSLSSIRLLAGSALAEQATPADRAERLRDIDRTAAEALRQVRAMIADLTPPELQDASLAAALERLAARTKRAGAPKVTNSTTGTAWPLTMPAATALLRTAQEALGNAVTHARATNVSLRLRFTEDEVTVDVNDDGVGFDAAAWFEHPELTATRGDGSGTGLRGLERRLRAQGGWLSVVSEPGEGALVRARLPRATAERTDVEGAA